MYEQQTRDALSKVKSFYDTYNNGVLIKRVWDTSYSSCMGKQQSLFGWREKRKLSRVYKLLNPHACTIDRTQCTSVSSLNPIKFKGAGTYEYACGGEILANSYKGCYPNSDLRFLKSYSAPSAINLRRMDRALVSAYAKAKSPQLPGIVMLAELKETLAMLRSPLQGVTKLIVQLFKKKKGWTNSKTVSEMTSQWLEYRYGIMPLILSIVDIQKAINTLLWNGYPLDLVHEGTSTLIQESEQLESVLYGTIRLNTKVRVREIVTVGASLTVQLKADRMAFYGFRLTDVPSAAFELIPLSFVWDWFFNVGDWIQAITPDPGLNVLASTCSIAQKYEASAELLSASWMYGTLTKTTDPHLYRYKKERLDRYVNPSLPLLPVLADEFFNYNRILDSISLLWGRASTKIKF